MFYHVKELQFDARIDKPDPKFATLLLEQFGGGNGELKAAMQYFMQAFACKKPHPDKYDMLMDIATEELGHLEIVGATITMLLDGLNGELKDAVETTYLSKLMNGKQGKEEIIHSAVAPQFLTFTGGGPHLTNSQGLPWSGAYVNANGDLTVDLRSNLGAESRAKIVYEYLLQYTEDKGVQETLKFLMAREVAHYKQFEAALETIQPNFPPGQLQADPKYSHVFFNTSRGNERGPWNEGQGTWEKGESWNYVEDPIKHVEKTKGMKEQEIKGASMTEKEAEKKSKEQSKKKSKEVKDALKKNPNSWSDYGKK